MAKTIFRCDKGDVHGIASMMQLKNGVKFNVYTERLVPGYHGIHIHEFGDMSRGCESMGEHYNPFHKQHGSRNDPEAHLGDLGNIYVNRFGISNESFVAKRIRLNDIIGKGLVIHERKDDLGKGTHKDSKTTGNSGKRILCGVIVFV